MEDLPVRRLDFDAEELVDGEDNEEFYDTCCSICDNGGDVLCCVGRCMRSFHATVASGEDECRTLGLSQAYVNDIPDFICKNCQYKQHQCFICGKLGSSDTSSNAEVFPCIAANCGRFYHPICVSKVLLQRKLTETEDLDKKIAAGESFVCPAHRCFVCKEVEDRMVKKLQFAVCRRCPKSYHRKCLPRESIPYDKDCKSKKVLARAWKGILPKRVLIYCLDHEIDPKLGTPTRDHLCFPKTKVKRDTAQRSDVVQKKRKLISFQSPSGSVIRKTGNRANKFGDAEISSMRPGALHSGRPPLHNGGSSSSAEIIEMEKRITSLIQEANSSFDEDEFRTRQNIPSMYNRNSIALDKNVTNGKVEVVVEAIQQVMHKLDSGGRVDDSKAICSPEMLSQVLLWKNKLQFYLAPFLYGNHYSSYGRHFTKVEKFQEIVDRLHNYVQDGDMIVDFCCGANDFSCLMKEKLDSVGKKKCSFKNYDLFPCKNDFNFEQKDWFRVDPEDLPPGSQLIMGLNPPFGAKASLANKFIKKALGFKPKLLILIVPPETQRLDSRSATMRYDLLWEDPRLLSGESFYIPGIFDAHGKSIPQWNKVSPPLYLWSRPDWTRKHQEIASKCGHAY